MLIFRDVIWIRIYPKNLATEIKHQPTNLFFYMDIHSYLFGDQDAWSKHFFSDINWYYKRFLEEYSPFVNYCWWKQILHQLICSLGLARYLQGFIHPWWCRISSINSSIIPKTLLKTTGDISLAYKTCPSYLHTKMSQGQRTQHISKNSTP